MHLGTERREQAHPPVTDLVAEPLDHDRAVVGHGARGLALVVEVLHQVAGGELVEPEVIAQPLLGGVGRSGPQLADELAHGPTELERPTGPVAVPERHATGLTGCRRDDHPIGRDVLDPPRARAQQEGLARSALVDHLFVELADAGAVGQEHTERALDRGSCPRS